LTVNRLKAALYDRVAAYWGGADIAWGSTDKVKPLDPLVILQLGTVTRASQPITQMINGIVFSAYPSTVPLQIDLFTRGREVDESEGEYSENTATSDLLDFVNFLDSTSTIEWSNKNDVSLILLGGVQDLSEIINDSQWQYRAMVEISVSFTQWAAEYNGVLTEKSIVFGEDGLPVGVTGTDWQQTASGGGKQELADEKTGFFEQTQVDYDSEKEGNIDG
jgi:hypothetical protein